MNISNLTKKRLIDSSEDRQSRSPVLDSPILKKISKIDEKRVTNDITGPIPLCSAPNCKNKSKYMSFVDKTYKCGQKECLGPDIKENNWLKVVYLFYPGHDIEKLFDIFNTTCKTMDVQDRLCKCEICGVIYLENAFSKLCEKCGQKHQFEFTSDILPRYELDFMVIYFAFEKLDCPEPGQIHHTDEMLKVFRIENKSVIYIWFNLGTYKNNMGSISQEIGPENTHIVRGIINSIIQSFKTKGHFERLHSSLFLRYNGFSNKLHIQDEYIEDHLFSQFEL